MSSNREETLRARAHQIWDEAGYSEGEHAKRWHQAEAEVAANHQPGQIEGEKPVRTDETPASGCSG